MPSDLASVEPFDIIAIPEGLMEKDELDTYFITKVYVTAYRPPSGGYRSRSTGRYLLHWSLTIQCKLRSPHQILTGHKQQEKYIYIHIENYPIIPDGFNIRKSKGPRDFPVFIKIRRSDDNDPFEPNTPVDARFSFPIAKAHLNRLTGRVIASLFEKHKYNQYQYDEKSGTGCLYLVKCILSDFVALDVFERSEEVKVNLEMVDALQKGTFIGEVCFVACGMGKFLKPHPKPKLRLPEPAK